ncbi:hypothetical protein [Pontibacter sp. H249]|uniref:hypothetical protein n=1 Tax=Pontibacter sp. H249 TaxID=3133420 RepID=UPI0030C2B85D
MSKINQHEFEGLTNADFNSVGITTGISLLATLPRARGKWAIQGDLVYRNFTAEDSYTSKSSNSSQNYTSTDTEFKLGYLGINASLRYKLADTKLSPYITAGVANNLMVSDNSSQHVYRKFYASESTKTQKPLSEFRKHEQALLLGAGVALSKFNAEIKMERGNGLSPFTGLKSARNSVTLLFGYTF